jgi:hypothetical protein
MVPPPLETACQINPFRCNIITVVVFQLAVLRSNLLPLFGVILEFFCFLKFMLLRMDF